MRVLRIPGSSSRSPTATIAITPQLAGFARRYADLADLCLVRMSELYPGHSVLIVDRAEFRVYRRNKRETIPLICPPTL